MAQEKQYHLTKRNFRCPDRDWNELEETVEFYEFGSKSELILHMIREINQKRKEEQEREGK